MVYQLFEEIDAEIAPGTMLASTAPNALTGRMCWSCGATAAGRSRGLGPIRFHCLTSFQKREATVY
jgi:hypothetical protein